MVWIGSADRIRVKGSKMSEGTIEWLIGTLIGLAVTICAAIARGVHYILGKIERVEQESRERDKEHDKAMDNLIDQIQAMVRNNDEVFQRRDGMREFKTDIKGDIQEVKRDMAGRMDRIEERQNTNHNEVMNALLKRQGGRA